MPTPNNEPTNSVPLSPQAICRAAVTPLAHSSILKPGGSLMLLQRGLDLFVVKPVGGGRVLATAVPFCSSVSSPMNQSAGGCSQKSFVVGIVVREFLGARAGREQQPGDGKRGRGSDDRRRARSSTLLQDAFYVPPMDRFRQALRPVDETGPQRRTRCPRGELQIAPSVIMAAAAAHYRAPAVKIGT